MKRIIGLLAGILFAAQLASGDTFNFSKIGDFGDGLYVYADTFISLVEEVTASVNNIATDQISKGAIETSKIADGAVTLAKIAAKTITNLVISDSAGIEFKKMEKITAGNIIVGNASGVPTQYPLTAINGDVALAWSYTTINDDKVTAAMMADGDHGAFTYSGNAASLDDDVVQAANMANGDHGAFTYTNNVAALDANSVGSSQIIDGSVTGKDISISSPLTVSNVNFSSMAGYKTYADAYWQVSTKDAWVSCRLEDKISCGATGKDVIAFVQVVTTATGPAGAIVQVALKPHDANYTSWNADNVSCPMAILYITGAKIGAAGAQVIPICAKWDRNNSYHRFWYQVRDYPDITGGYCFISVLGWTAYEPL